MTSTIGAIAAMEPSNHPLCHSGGSILTRRDWRLDVDRLVHFLDRRHEHRWGLYASSSYDFSVGLFALWLSRKTPVIPPMNTPGVVTTLAPCVDGLLGEFPLAASILRGANDTTYDRTHRHIDPDAELVMFTSGSSGEPKAIPKRIGQLDAEVATLELLWGSILNDDIILATVSHQHIYGLLFKVLWPLATGRAFSANTLRDPQALLTQTARHHRSVWVTSPAYLKRIPTGILASIEPGRVVTLFSSGGPLATSVAHRIAQYLTQPPIEVYGSTETGGVAHRQQRPEEDDTSWQTLPGVVIKTNDDGRLLVRSPHLPDDDWHLTGDQGTIIARGRFKLGPRIDRIVKVEEKRVSLTAMEAVLTAFAGVTESACVVRPGRRDLICAVVALDTSGYRDLYSSGRRQYIQQLRKTLIEHFDRVTVPRKWRFVKTLPANEQGKVSAADLLALFEPSRVQRLPTVVSIDRRNDDEATLTLFVPKHLVYFQGHFPGSPVVPGVVQLLWVDEFARQLLGHEHGWRQMEAVKFNRLVLPESTLTLRLEIRHDRQQLRFSYSMNGRVCSSGRLLQRE